MPGSKNRKNTKTTGTDYNKLKATDAENWSKKIKDVSTISFKLSTANTRDNLFKAIGTYFEVLKYAFPSNIIERALKVDRNFIDGAESLQDNLELNTLKNKNEGQTYKWLKKVNDSFTMFANIQEMKTSEDKTLVNILKARCQQFNSLMKISPVYIGHKPLFKYTNVREAFKKLGSNVANLPKLVQNATAKLELNKKLVHST